MHLRKVIIKIALPKKSGYKLTTHSLSSVYNEANKFEFPDFRVNSGDDLLIFGESGIGKTTLFHLISALLKPKFGKTILGETVCH